MSQLGKLYVVGFGPGDFKHITTRAVEALQESDFIIGYKTYVELIQDLIDSNTSVISTGMTEEVSRAQEAVRQAENGKKVAVISSGDSGVYGMAGLVYEVLIEKGWTEATGVEIEVIPGISAINSCASLLGAPVMHDSCTISLSDHLTPWDLIAKRVEAAAMADFVIALYNPRSGRRTRQIVETQRILLQYRSPETPVGLVKSAYRDRQNIIITNLKDMLNHDIGMLTTVVIGNSSTFLYDNKMITPRGYQRKYTLNAEKQPLKPHQRLKEEAEPWAMDQETGIQRSQIIDSAPALVRAKQPSVVKTEPKPKIGSFEMALDALTRVTGQQVETQTTFVQQEMESIFELAVSPGVANKRFTPKQMMTLADVVGDKGTMEYTPNHNILLKIPTTKPDFITARLQDANFILSPVGDVVTIKACDFCDGDKTGGIPYAEELQEKLGGLNMPKEFNIGFNGCGMACYKAVMEDVGIVYRKGKFDLFVGAKPVGRTAHPGQPVAEGIEPEKIVEVVSNIVEEYRQNAHPNERLFKYFKRVKRIQGFNYQDMSPKIEIEPAPCGD
ncbi:precorrin-3B C(17)-methyltransferase [Viridibacillus sp. FSL R5-0477]|uniref:Cobalt-precorrin-3B C(17)-methyltransferase n=1 Tax=Viridibacillus arenosi FSL R5-213 TaxID=1227360 RepID=W4F0I6_9BACL|nr:MULTISPECIES: precorrin-3B C(17)-methyltransferase [Viridibacillus]ETT86305.1 cobalt-precorrin-3B C(17)-methyltransferase [Viridibacillus arenosi FSL R5-213]OMC84795.1 precorrin-3B C(17)-methyltransferase [Viridibacillus sp. FSL H8-0123]OMC91843.1 precorrin-3B C(17)-methyltransferase [Viridibacillus arenosi]